MRFLDSLICPENRVQRGEYGGMRGGGGKRWGGIDKQQIRTTHDVEFSSHHHGYRGTLK